MIRLLPLLLLAACGAEPTFVTAHGVEVHDLTGRATQSEVEQIHSDLIDCLGYGRKALRYMSVTVRDGCEKDIKGHDWCEYYRLDFQRVYVNHPLDGLAHGTIHHVRHFITAGDPDYDHKSDAWRCQ